MEEKKLLEEKTATVEELVKKINKIIGDKFSVLDEENDIEKWNSVPKLLLLDDNRKKQILSFVEFIDSLLISLEEKAMYVISLCGLLEFGNIMLENYDNGCLFTLADYYQNSSIDEIKNTLTVIGNKDLLLAVRKKTLDLEARKKILSNIVDLVGSNRVNTNNKTEFSQFLEKTIKELEEKDYYDLIK